MTDQELRAWSLAISAIVQKDKTPDFSKLVGSATVISGYIKTGDVPSKEIAMGLWNFDSEKQD
jgi:hypothetical protein